MFVCGAGTGGTITGVGRKLKEKLPNCLIVGADPYGSVLAYPEELNKTSITFYEIEGIGGDFVPMTLDRAVVDKWVKCTDKDAFTMARRLIRQEGLLCGGSSGTAMHCAVQAAKDYNLGSGSRVVVLLPDNIRNYMSKFLLDDWMNARGFLEAPKEKDYDTKYWWRSKELSVLRLHSTKKMSVECKVGDAAKRFKKYDIIAVFQKPDKKIVGTLTSRVAMTSIAGGKKNVKLKDIIDRNFRSLLITDTLGKLESYFENDSHVLIFKLDPKTNFKQLLGYLSHMDLAEYICRNNP